MELDALRSKIEELTESIFDQVASRQKLALKVAEIKRKKKLPIENPQVEAKLEARMGAYAQKNGIEEAQGRILLSQLFTLSKNAQRKAYYHPSVKSFLATQGIRTIGVIGSGRMGKWFTSYFLSFGQNVVIFDKEGSKARKTAKELNAKAANDLKAFVKETDLVIVAVPIGSTRDVIQEIAGIKSKQQSNQSKNPFSIIEITSVKGPIGRSALYTLYGENARKPRLYSIHPLFGGDSPLFAHNKMIEVTIPQQSKGKVSDFLRGIFPHFEWELMDYETHDKMMAYVLTLPHVLSLIFATVILSRSTKKGRPKLVTGPSFDWLLQLSKRVAAESPDVYFEIQAANPYNERLVHEAGKALTSLRKIRQDKEQFSQFFQELAEKLRLL